MGLAYRFRGLIRYHQSGSMATPRQAWCRQNCGFFFVVVVGLSRQSFFCVALAVLGELRILHLHLKAASGRLASSHLG